MKNHTQDGFSNQWTNEEKGSPETPKAPVKLIDREDASLVNSLKELLTGPPAVKRNLFKTTNNHKSDESDIDVVMDDVESSNFLNGKK